MSVQTSQDGGIRDAQAGAVLEFPGLAADGDLCVLGWAMELELATPEQVLRWAHGRWGSELTLATSFQAEGMVLLHMCHQLGLPVRIVTLDTGRLPEETFRHIEHVRLHYGVDVEIVAPRASDVARLVKREGPNLFYASVDGRQRCCNVRKVEPMRRALARTPAWLSGLRRDQTPTRDVLNKVEVDRVTRTKGRLVKVCPLLDWTEDQVWAYIHEEGVPYHPLYDRGYRTIGCAPCTRPSRPGEGARGGRWWWESHTGKECGLHVLQPR